MIIYKLEAIFFIELTETEASVGELNWSNLNLIPPSQ
jgi:hypothetical protein